MAENSRKRQKTSDGANDDKHLKEIVHELSHHDLKEMLEFIKNLSSVYEVHSAIVFRGVVQANEVEDWKPIEEEFKVAKRLIQCYRLLDGIYGTTDGIDTDERSRNDDEDEFDDRGFDNNNLDENLYNLYSKAIAMRSNAEDAKLAAVAFVEWFFKSHADESRESAKSAKRFADIAVKDFPSLLDSVKNPGLRHENNSLIGEMPGIDLPVFSVGALNTFTPMHVKDGVTDSISILRSGSPKLWIIIEHSNYAKLNDVLCTHLYGDKSNPRPNIDYNDEKCRLPTHHENLMLTPKFLDKNEINYRFVLQLSGDAIYVRHAVAHQVWDLGRNFAETINYGSDRWKASNALVMSCTCEMNSVEPIRLSEISNDRQVNRNPKKSPICCPLPGCLALFPNNTEVEEHMLKSKNHKVKIYCLYCSKSTYAANYMSTHLKVHGQMLKDLKLTHFHLRSLIKFRFFKYKNIDDVKRNSVFWRIKRLKQRYDEISVIASEEHGELSLLDETHEFYSKRHSCTMANEAIAYFDKTLPKVKDFWSY